MHYLIKIPKWMHRIYPGSIWEIPTSDKSIYLTFDDGPTQQLTEFIIGQLELYNAKATFFCTGEHVTQMPGIYELLLQKGHSTGNHTWNHVDGWRTHTDAYMKNILDTKKVIHSDLFRPPFGRLKRKQLMQLRQHRFQNIMWSITSGDFDPKITAEECFRNIYSNVLPGAIILMHDNKVAEEKVRLVLPKLLQQLSAEGYTFRPIVS